MRQTLTLSLMIAVMVVATGCTRDDLSRALATRAAAAAGEVAQEAAALEALPATSVATASAAPGQIAAAGISSPMTVSLLATFPALVATPTPVPTTAPTQSPTTRPPTAPTAAPPSATTVKPTVAATASPTAVPTVAAAATATATTAPTAAATDEGYLQPGGRVSMMLFERERASYLVRGRAGDALVLIVRPESRLDASLAFYAGDQTGVSDRRRMLASADRGGRGEIEVLMYSPDEDGTYTYIVRSGDTRGKFAAALYSLLDPAPGVLLQEAGSLAAGEAMEYAAASEPGHGILIMVRPADSSNLILDLFNEAGERVTTSNYTGRGGLETAYAVPAFPMSYTIRVRAAANEPSDYHIAIVSMR